REVVREVLAQLGKPAGGNGRAANGHARGGEWGVFETVDDAVAAAQDGFVQLSRLSLADRDRIIRVVKDLCVEQAEELGRLEYEETKIGRLDHKIEKLKIIERVPGVEFLRTDA